LLQKKEHNMTWGLVNNNRIFIFGRTIPLNSHNVWYRKQTLRFTQTVCLSTTKCKQFESTCWWKAEHTDWNFREGWKRSQLTLLFQRPPWIWTLRMGATDWVLSQCLKCQIRALLSKQNYTTTTLSNLALNNPLMMAVAWLPS